MDKLTESSCPEPQWEIPTLDELPADLKFDHLIEELDIPILTVRANAA